MLRQKWTDEQTERLMELWPTHSAGVIAQMMGVSRNAIIGRAHRLRIDKIIGRTVSMENKPALWSQGEDAMLRAQWGKVPVLDIIKELAALSGARRSYNSVRHRVDRLGLPKIRTMYPPAPARIAVRTLRAMTPTRPRVEPAPPPEPWDGPSISMLDPGLSHFMCREIVAGSGPETMFCGAPTRPGSPFSYCAFHAAKNLTQPRKTDARPKFVAYRLGMAA